MGAQEGVQRQLLRAPTACMPSTVCPRMQCNKPGQPHPAALPAALTPPDESVQAMGRLKKNVAYFRVNYMITTCGVTSLVLLMNLWSLVVLAGLALMWFYFYMIKTTPVVLGGRELR